MVIAEKFGVLPDDVENRMSEYYFERVLEWMAGEAIAAESGSKK